MVLRCNIFMLSGAAVAAVGAVFSGVQRAPAANLGVTPGTSPVVGVTLGSSGYGAGIGGGPSWGNSGGYGTAGHGATGGYFPTATNVLVSAGGGYPVLTTTASVSPPPYPWGSSNSFNSAGAGALGLSTLPVGTAVAPIAAYVTTPPEVVYDFAQSSSNYAGLTAATGAVDTYNTGSGAHPGYKIAPIPTVGDSAYANVNASVSSNGAGVTWSPNTGAAVGFGSQPAIVSASTGAISATNNAAIGLPGRTMLVWSAGGYVPGAGSFVDFGLNTALSAGPAAAKGAGPIIFAFSTRGPSPTGFLTTGSGAYQVALAITGIGANSTGKTFANGDSAYEGYTVTPGGRVGYDFTFWAVSLSGTFPLNSGADLAGTATAAIFGNEGTSLALNPALLPANYSGDAPGFSYFAVPEPGSLAILALGGLPLLARRRVGSRAA